MFFLRIHVLLFSIWLAEKQLMFTKMQNQIQQTDNQAKQYHHPPQKKPLKQAMATTALK